MVLKSPNSRVSIDAYSLFRSKEAGFGIGFQALGGVFCSYTGASNPVDWKGFTESDQSFAFFVDFRQSCALAFSKRYSAPASLTAVPSPL